MHAVVVTLAMVGDRNARAGTIIIVAIQKVARCIQLIEGDICPKSLRCCIKLLMPTPLAMCLHARNIIIEGFVIFDEQLEVFFILNHVVRNLLSIYMVL